MAGNGFSQGFRVQTAGELRPALESALTSDRPCIIDVPVDYRENIRLAERLGQLVCPI